MNELRISEQALIAESPLNTWEITNEDSGFLVANRESKRDRACAEPSKMPGCAE